MDCWTSIALAILTVYGMTGSCIDYAKPLQSLVIIIRMVAGEFWI